MDSLYTARATATGGRTGRARSDDGQLDVGLTSPKELGGRGGDGTNPEQLFAAGYSACFLSALQLVAKQDRIDARQATVQGEVGLGPDGDGFGLAATLTVTVPGVDRDTAQGLAEKAHQVCPYSRATRGNIEVQLAVVDPPG